MGRRKRNYSESDNSSDEDFISEASLSALKGAEGSIGSNVSQENGRKRGRGPSKRPCLNRNAMMARVNRQRKKEYLEKIENKLAYYRKSNNNLTNVIQQQGIDIKRLTAEVTYLKNVLNNNTSITALLRTMNEVLQQSKSSGTSEVDKWDSEKLKGMMEPANEFSFKLPDSSTSPAPGINCDSSFKGSLTFTPSNPNVNNCTEDSQLGLSDVDINQLEDFDTDIFDLPVNSEGSNGIDLFGSHQNQPENLFDNLDNSGICLHVNSGRISLEYCSICHLNSVNSDAP